MTSIITQQRPRPRQTRTTRSASPISGNTPLPTSNRFSGLSDDQHSTEVTLKVVRSANSLHKIYVGKFDPETSEADIRSYVKRHVVQDESDIALRSQSHSAPSSCSFCVVVGSSAARKALFEKSHWPRDVTGRVFKPTIPKGSGSRRDRGQRRDGNRTRDGNRRRHGNNMETSVMLLTYVIEMMSTHMIRAMATQYNDSTTRTGRRGHKITERDHGADPTHLTTISISCRKQ